MKKLPTDSGTLLSQALAGDKAAQEILFISVQDVYKPIVYRALGDFATDERVNDVIEDAFSELLNGLQRGSVDLNKNWPGWLYQRCRYCADRLRATLIALDNNEIAWDETIHDSGACDPMIENFAEAHDLQVLLREVLLTLSREDRDIILRRYMCERTPEEIAADLAIDRGAVDTRLSRARERFRLAYTRDSSLEDP